MVRAWRKGKKNEWKEVTVLEEMRMSGHRCRRLFLVYLASRPKV